MATETDGPIEVRTGRAARADARGAAAELARTIRGGDGPALTILFASSKAPVDELVATLADALPGHELVGCTTAGEISPDGFHQGAAVALSLRGGLTWTTARVDGLSSFTHLDGKQAVAELRAGLRGGDLGDDTCTMLLVDGLRGREEMLTASLGAAAPAMRLFGASASDDFRFERTEVFHQGAAHTDAALLVTLRPEVPFELLRLQHFRATDHKVVVTGAAPEQRLILELDGKPAVEVLAELMGEPPEALRRSGRHLRPFATIIRGEPYIRSIMRAEGDALRFACAVEEGTVLTQMEAGDLVASTAAGLERARARVGGDVRAMLAFNCLGRLFEARDTGREEPLADVFRGWPVIGFHTYGEQYGPLHINNTLTGLVLGSAP